MTIERIGSQSREPISESGMVIKFHPNNDGEVVLVDEDGGKLELWQKNDDFAGYVIEINGDGYEFCCTLTDSMVAELKKKKKDARLAKCYKMGYDAGKNGPNKTNCHFSLFATQEQSDEWSAGNRDGISAKIKLENNERESKNEQ